jgi:hypothetical protein
MEADQMQPRTGNQRGESLHEFQRRHHDMGRAISIGCLQCEHHLPGPIEYKTFIGDGGAGDVAAEVFEFLPLMGGTAHLGMEAKALLVDTVPRGRAGLLKIY